MTLSLPAVLPAIEQLLRRQIGLNSESVGRDRIAHAVRARLAHRGQDGAAYLQLLLDSADELHALIDEVVVPETWFFRDRRAFHCLRRQVQGRREKPFRILSVPCCTGEEPYSIAMLLLDACGAPAEFEVVATDVSRAALTAAATASYAEPSFRETEAEFVALQDRFCLRKGTRRVVAGEVAARVRFLQANLAGPLFLEEEPAFHAIFCRNLFIYLDEQARCTALTHLRRLLLPGGLLYLSAVEAGLLADAGFRKPYADTPFVFTRMETKENPAPARPHASRVRKTKTPLRKGVAGAESSKPRRGTPSRGFEDSPPATTSAVNGGIEDQLTKARQAADAGRLVEAAILCMDLAAGEPQPEVFCLLGIVRQAQGDLVAAERCYQRALYLDPRHHETLVHMALLARRRGDDRLADNFFRRADRTGKGD